MGLKVILPLLMALVFGGAIVIPRMIQPDETEDSAPVSPALMPSASAPEKALTLATNPITEPTPPAPPPTAPPQVSPDPSLLDPFFQHLARSDYDQAQVYLEKVAEKLPETTRANLTSALAASKRERQELQSALRETRDLLKELKGTPTSPPPPRDKGPLPSTVPVSFGYDSSVVAEADKPKLADVAKTLAGRKDLEVDLRGFADTSGDPRYNAILASARAEAVRDVLVLQGADNSRIRVVPFGESQTSPDADPATARRVDVVFR